MPGSLQLRNNLQLDRVFGEGFHQTSLIRPTCRSVTFHSMSPCVAIGPWANYRPLAFLSIVGRPPSRGPMMSWLAITRQVMQTPTGQWWRRWDGQTIAPHSNTSTCLWARGARSSRTRFYAQLKCSRGFSNLTESFFNALSLIPMVHASSSGAASKTIQL